MNNFIRILTIVLIAIVPMLIVLAVMNRHINNLQESLQREQSNNDQCVEFIKRYNAGVVAAIKESGLKHIPMNLTTWEIPKYLVIQMKETQKIVIKEVPVIKTIVKTITKIVDHDTYQSMELLPRTLEEYQGSKMFMRELNQ